MMKLYAMPKSGNCYKVAWMLRLLNLDYEFIPTSFVDGGTKSEAFLQKNPNGQVPLLELDNGQRLAESNAILLYLAEQQTEQADTITSSDEKTRNLAPLLLPRDDYVRALTYQWLFFEQYSHEPAIAVRRANVIFDRPCAEERMQLLLNMGNKALTVMEKQLDKTEFLVRDEGMTIADIALFAYTHVAHEGGYDLSTLPNIQRWLKRVRQSPGFCGMGILEQTKLQGPKGGLCWN